MAKRQHRKGGRTTPKGTRPGEHTAGAQPRSQAELLLRDARHIARTCTDINEAEGWASSIQSVFRPHGFPPKSGASPKSVLREARDEGGAAAVVLATAMSVYGPESTRQEAADLAEKLIDDGSEIPAWTRRLGQVEPGRAMMMTDVWNDGCSIYLDCSRDGQTIGVGTSIDSIGGLVAHGFVYGPTTARLEQFAAREPDTIVVQIDPADARATVEAALAMADETVGFAPEPDPDDHDPDLRALIEHRFSLLPAGGKSLMQYHELYDGKAELTAEFLARPDATDLPDVDDMIDTICTFAGYCDGDPLRWSPTRVETFLSIWVPAKVIADDKWYTNLPIVLREWLRFAADSRGLPQHALDLNLATVDRSTKQMHKNRDDPAMVTPGSAMIRELLDSGIDPTDKPATQKWIDDHNTDSDSTKNEEQPD